MDAEQQKRILGYFLMEAQEHLATLQQAVAAMAQPLGDHEQVSDWFRAAHSIKGGAAMLGLEALQQVALRLEDCLKILRDQGVGRNLSLSLDMVALFQQGVTGLAGLVAQVEREGAIPFELGQQVVIEHEPVFIQLEALLQILVQGEQVMAGWEATVPDREPPVLATQPEQVEPTIASGSEELDLVELFASLDAQGSVAESEHVEATVIPTNTPQELASLAQLFSLSPEEGGGEFLDEAAAVGGEQTVEDLGALADLFTLGDEEPSAAEPEAFDFSGVGAEAMALEALNNLPPLSTEESGFDSGNELGEFNFDASESGEEFTTSFGESDLGFSEALEEVPGLDFTGGSGVDLGEFNFDASESEEEFTTSFGESDLGFSEALEEVPALDFTGESRVDLGEFNFEASEPEEELTASFGESDLGFSEGLEEIPTLEFTGESGLDLGEFNFEASEPEEELTASFGESDLGFSEGLEEIPTLEFTGESGLDLGEFNFEATESEEEFTTSFGESDLGFSEGLETVPTLEFTGESGLDLGEFNFEAFESEEESSASFGESDLGFTEGLEEVPGLDFTGESGADLGEFNFEISESEEELTTSFGESDLGFSEGLEEVPALDFTGESRVDLGEFNFEISESEEELTASFGESDLGFSEGLEEVPALDFTGESGVDLGEFNFDDANLTTETLGELSFADIPEIPEELSFDASGLLGNAGSDLEATLSAFVEPQPEEIALASEAVDAGMEAQMEALDEEIANLDDLAAGIELDEELDFDLSGTDQSDLTSGLDLPDLPDLNLAELGEDFSLGQDLGDLDDLLADVPDLTDLGALEQDLAIASAPVAPPPPVAAPEPAPAEPRSGGLVEQSMRVPVRQLDNLSNLIGELVVSRNTLNEDQNRLRQFLENLLHQAHQLNDLSQRMQDLYERSLLEGALSASRGGGGGNFLNLAEEGTQHSTGAEFDALEMDRFTGFHTLSQEIAERVLRVRESASDIGFMVEAFDEVVQSFQRITAGLQEGINNARMEPFSRVTDRLPRAVRNVALKCGKQVTLEIEGRETLVDKMILEKLTDPMTHLVNNAIVHGIGLPAQRQAAGQSPAGRIVIRAAYQGNQTVITVSDDGVGINPDRVKAKAIEKGVITPQQAATMTKQDIYQLLFAAGFSTKDQADEFAGRGVGLDVVRSNLAEIRGTVMVDSELGKGTTFTIRLPLTLSISKSLPCVVSHAQVAFPMDGVADVPVDVTPDMIHTGADGKLTLDWAGKRIPLRQLSELLHYGRLIGRGNIYGTSTQEGLSVVVVNSLGRYVAFQVNQVMSEQEVVIKQLTGPVHKPLGIAGATILGDGRIMMIADILELVDLALGQMPPPSTPLWAGMTPVEPETTDEPTVLIVDDSITVREMLSMTFSNKGYRVEQARDGLEAWEKLQDGLPCDLMFCDIEMPRMDGLELLSKVRRDAGLKQLPIAMLTSRGAERHRQMAIQLGANAYFTKPYLEETLLEAARRLLQGESLVSSVN